MITFVSKLPIKPMTCLEFHKIIATLHSLNSLEDKDLIKLDNGYIIQDEKIIAYHIEDNDSYEYIYSENTNEVLISLDKKRNHQPIDLLTYLMNHHLLAIDLNIKIKDIPHYCEKNLPKTSYLPIIYFNSNLAKPSILNETSSLLKGMAHVLYGNKELDETMKNHHHSTYESYAILYNNDYMGFSKLKNESDESFAYRVYYKIQSYMTKRVFEYPFNMNDLYQKALSKMIKNSRENEDLILEKFDNQLSKLENNKQKYIQQIDELTKQIEYLKFQVEINEKKMNDICSYPLLFKGNEDEFYDGEQKDMVLSLIKEELKVEKDSTRIQLLNEILKENPPVGNRSEKLNEIYRILLSSKQVGERQIELLKKYGICLLDSKENHLKGNFYDDSRYPLTVSSSPSDLNTGRQLYREIRKVCF